MSQIHSITARLEVVGVSSGEVVECESAKRTWGISGTNL
jgi:hypothetical protein